MTPEPLEITEDRQARRVRRATLATRAFIVLACVYAALVPALVLWVVFEIEDQQASAAQTLAETRRNTELIESCVTPGGECAERSRENTAEVVDTINEAVTYAAIYAAACADRADVQTVAEIESCVRDRLAEKLSRD